MLAVTWTSLCSLILMNIHMEVAALREERAEAVSLDDRLRYDSTYAGDLMELLRVPLRSQGYCGVGLHPPSDVCQKLSLSLFIL